LSLVVLELLAVSRVLLSVLYLSPATLSTYNAIQYNIRLIEVVRTQLSNKTYTYYQLGIFAQLSDNKMLVIGL